MYEIYFGQLPYGKKVSIEQIKNIIIKEESIYSEKSGYTELDELFKKLLTVNHYNRINFKEFFSLVDNIFTKIIEIKFDLQNFKRCSHYNYGYEFGFVSDEKIKNKEAFINYNKYECLDDKLDDLVMDEDEKIVKKIKKILKNGKLLNIMDIPNRTY